MSAKGSESTWRGQAAMAGDEGAHGCGSSDKTKAPEEDGGEHQVSAGLKISEKASGKTEDGRSEGHAEMTGSERSGRR